MKRKPATLYGVKEGRWGGEVRTDMGENVIIYARMVVGVRMRRVYSTSH